MAVSEQLIQTVIEQEGFKSQAYPDGFNADGSVRYSIGYGTEASGPDATITRDRAYSDLTNYLSNTRSHVASYGETYGYNWNDTQIDALTSFSYNTGHGTLNSLTKNGTRTDEEIASSLILYNKQRLPDGTYVEVAGLASRRQVESQLFQAATSAADYASGPATASSTTTLDETTLNYTPQAAAFEEEKARLWYEEDTEIPETTIFGTDAESETTQQLISDDVTFRYDLDDPESQQAQMIAEQDAEFYNIEEENVETAVAEPPPTRRPKDPGDWRVRLQLAPGSNYLYNAPDAGILAPLTETDGIIFPYTPQITVSHMANYASTDLVHSNYQAHFYRNSYPGRILVNAKFTAQDTNEANYLLAVIHFIKTASKMFYGQDDQRGTPPPLLYLSGMGDFQYNEHPCVMRTFNYVLPDDVDYIRAGTMDAVSGNFRAPVASTTSRITGLTGAGADLINLGNQFASAVGSAASGVSSLLDTNTSGADILNTAKSAIGGTAQGFTSSVDSSLNRLAAAGLPDGAAMPTLNGFASGLSGKAPTAQGTSKSSTGVTYVPTMISISIELTPIQTREQQSKYFSLNDYANGSLLKKGFW